MTGAVLREQRRTSVITLASEQTGRADVIRACEPECRDAILLDLGLKGSGGGSAFRSHGEAAVRVAWNGTGYRVTWKRCRPSALLCDHCGEEWRSRPGRPKRELTEAQRRALAAGQARLASSVKAGFPAAGRVPARAGMHRRAGPRDGAQPSPRPDSTSTSEAVTT